jgi:hypothetical protein
MPERRFKNQITDVLSEQLPDSAGGALEQWLAPTTESKVEQIPIEEVHDRGWRGEVDPTEPSYRALKASIRASGVLQPLLLRPHPDGGFEVVSGARRLRAARETAQSTVPAVVRELNDVQALVGGSWDALLRAGLTPAESAELVGQLVEAGMEEGQATALVGTVPVREAAAGDEAEEVVVVDEAAAVEPNGVAVEAPAEDEVVTVAAAVEVEPVAADAVEVEAIQPEAVESETVEAPVEVEAVEVEAVEPATVEADAIEVEAVEPDTAEAEPVEAEVVEPEPIEAVAEIEVEVEVEEEEVVVVIADEAVTAEEEPAVEDIAVELAADSSELEEPEAIDIELDDIGGWPVQESGPAATAPTTPPAPVPVDPVTFPLEPLSSENGAAPSAGEAPAETPVAEASPAEAEAPVEEVAPAEAPPAEAAPEDTPAAEAAPVAEVAPAPAAHATIQPPAPPELEPAAVAAPSQPPPPSPTPRVIPIKLPEPSVALASDDDHAAGSMPVAAPAAGDVADTGSRLVNEPVPAVRMESAPRAMPTLSALPAMLRRGPLFYAVLGIGLAVGAIVFILVTVVEGVGSGAAPIIAAVVVAVVGFVTAMISLAQPRQRR